MASGSDFISVYEYFSHGADQTFLKHKKPLGGTEVVIPTEKFST